MTCQTCGRPAAIHDPTYGPLCASCAPTVRDLATIALSAWVADRLLESPEAPLEVVLASWASAQDEMTTLRQAYAARRAPWPYEGGAA